MVRIGRSHDLQVSGSRYNQNAEQPDGHSPNKAGKDNMRFKFRLGLMAYCVLAYCVLACAAIEGVSAQQKYAVVVGVETYDTSIFKNLRYAKEDAEAIGLALTRLGFDVSLMTSEAGTTALKPNSPKKILTAIRNKAKGLRPHDTFVVTLSGHGIQFVDDKAVDGVKEHYFCPEDADPADVGTLVKFSDVSAIFEQCKATRKLLIVDACRNEILSKAADKSGLGECLRKRTDVARGNLHDVQLQ